MSHLFDIKKYTEYVNEYDENNIVAHDIMEIKIKPKKQKLLLFELFLSINLFKSLFGKIHH